MLLQVQALSLALAEKMAEAAEAFAVEKGLTLAFAIMDNHGNLKLFKRMDGNNFVSVRMAQLKAMTSASIPVSTKTLAERNTSYANSPYTSVPDIVFLEGGLPIISKTGQHLGSIGVSGANPELDGQCAQAALDAIRGFL
ncbi:hypothetical protein B1207_04290 [Legionella quinlivanii]|uniref:Heme-binding protein n=1 Tax=Legionella quinlivanii TaxID=45073 RepID=A0A364LKY3_9GAMM|nr:heme-binding protein [Legionella quinlivanii]RAP37400.1 hypothetical protein B1207_04290 [Legionella quinlivanii]